MSDVDTVESSSSVGEQQVEVEVPKTPDDTPLGAVPPAGTTAPREASPAVLAVPEDRRWKALALIAGVGEFEGGWLPPLAHAVDDALLVGEFLDQAGYDSTVDLTNALLYRAGERPKTHRCGQLSHWEVRRHFENAVRISEHGLVFFYLHTRAAHGPGANPQLPPDSICFFNDNGMVKISEFIQDFGALAAQHQASTGGKAVLLLDLHVTKGVDHAALPNFSSECPHNFACLISLTPESASVFTPKFLSALNPGSAAEGTRGASRAVNLKDVLWSDRMSHELSAIAAACVQQEEAASVPARKRGWVVPTWVPVTAAASIEDPVMTYPLTSPLLNGNFHETSSNLLVTLTKPVAASGSVPAAFTKLKEIDGVLGRGQVGVTAIRSMQPIQCVIDTQATSTPMNSWEAFRTQYGLSTATLQKHESPAENPSLPANHMRFFLKFGNSYDPDSLAEVEWRKVEAAVLTGAQLYFGTDPRADMAYGETACKIRALALRVEATYKVTASSQLPILADARTPAQVSALVRSHDGVYEIDTLKLRSSLAPDTAGVRYRADLIFQKKQHTRIGNAQKIDISKAVQSNQQGLVHPSDMNRGLVEYLEVSQDVQIECAIRIQSAARMFVVRKRYTQMMWQLGEVPYTGPEMRVKMSQWLLAAAHHLQWRPTSTPVVLFGELNGHMATEEGVTPEQMNSRATYRNFVRNNIAKDACQELGVPEGSVRLEGVAFSAGLKVVTRLSCVSSWMGPGDAVPAEVRVALDAQAQRLRQAFDRGSLQRKYSISSATVTSKRPMKHCPHLDLGTVTPVRAIQGVLSGHGTREPIPAPVRRILERGVSDPNTAKQNMIIVLLSDPDCSVPSGWQRTLLEAPLLPGPAVCQGINNAALSAALQSTAEQRDRARRAGEYWRVQDVLWVAWTRADREDLTYELPGVRQLAKTPMVLYSKFWADAGYYEDEDLQYQKMAEAHRTELMMVTSRTRAALQREYQAHLWVDLWRVAKREIGACKLSMQACVTVLLMFVVTYMLYLLPKWAANVVALLYVENFSSMSLENIITWILIYGLVLFAVMLLLGLMDGYGRHLLAYKMRALFVYICAKYNCLVSATMVTTLREHDIRKAVKLLFGDVVKVFICLLGLIMCLGRIFTLSIALGLITFLYLIYKLFLHITYDRFMTRHMTAVANIDKEEQLRWVVLKGPEGAAGHVAAQAADDHQMRLCLFSREKQDVHTSNLVVHTCVAVLDWMLLFCVPVFYLYVAAHMVADREERGYTSKMWQRADRIPEAVFYFFLAMLFYRVAMSALVEIVENRPAILRLLTVLSFVELTDAERAEMGEVMSLKKGDEALISRMGGEGGGGHRNERELQEIDDGDDPAVPGTARDAPPAEGYRVKTKGWYRKKLLLEFDWYAEILQQNPSSGALLYLCYAAWVVLLVILVVFIMTSWATECEPAQGTCTVLYDGYNLTSNITVAQEASEFGKCTLMAPVSYLLQRCANTQRQALGFWHQNTSRTWPDKGSMRVQLEYESWQGKPIGFAHTYQWNETHPDVCPEEDGAWLAYKVLPFKDVYDEDNERNKVFPKGCLASRYRPP
eukprot:TRINITY_DN2937_c3_g1_i2.p1 TRINITY_DN2937_c3_g1~~TRINITY_DN2937_c3_g1_i2.p1  ORF type:complete len:1573 (+),score=483.41 TRINITY_DN2937_c3_g1_i2:98-4816(+)